MELALLGLALVALLAFNAFFVLSEFAIVKVRPSRVMEMIDSGDRRAVVLMGIQQHLDEYLSVCQVGITLASVALGMVGKKSTDAIMGGGHDFVRYAIAICVSYFIVAGSHIVVGELVPKSIAIRLADRASLWCARPLRGFHVAFFPALWLLASVANLILHLVGIPAAAAGEMHSEEELRIILDRSQERGMLSFRQLLFMENVFDLRGLTVRDAMRPRAQVQCLRAQDDWNTNLAVIRTSRFTRYPLIEDDPDRPLGVIHVKDVLVQGDACTADLRTMVRPLLRTPEQSPLEALLAEMQRRRIHLALVHDEVGRWTGLVTLEDVIEEIVGTIRDEFEDEEVVRLGDLLSVDHIHLDISANTLETAVQMALLKMPASLLPLPPERILRAVEDRERVASTYLGEGIAMPHARVAGLPKPFVMLVRSDHGIRCSGSDEKAQLLLVLLTPAGQPRIHQKLQSVIASLLHESDYVKERLLAATSPAEMLDAIRTGEQASLG